MDGVVIERTRPRLQTRITLWTLRLGSSGRGEPAGKYVSRDRRSGVSGGDVTSPVVRFRGPRGGVPRRMRNALCMAMGPRRRVFRVRDRRSAMRWDFVERERHPHTCTTRAAGADRPRARGARTYAAHGAPDPHDPGRARDGGCPHYGGCAKPTAHCAAAHAHSHTTLTPTRQAAPAATTSTAATRRLLDVPDEGGNQTSSEVIRGHQATRGLLDVRSIVLLPRRRLEPAPCALRGSASAPLLVRDAHGEQPSLHVQASHFPLTRKLHALERHRRERRQGV